MAYYFHWPRSEIWAMNRKERYIWLKQISRIHGEVKKQREAETLEQALQILAARNEE